MAEPNFRKDQPYLMQLPLEMILAIGEFLPTADLACLAMTCKNMFTILDDMEKFRDKLKRDKKEKGTFLSRLEQSLPGLVYCPFLKMLAPYNYKGKVNMEGKVNMNRSNGRRVIRQALHFSVRPIYNPNEFINSWAAATYEQIRLMRNYQLFGPQHGLAPSSLDRQYRTRRGQMVCMKRQCHTRTEGSHQFRWIDGELFLSRTKTVFLTGLKKKKNVSFKGVEQFISEHNAVMCSHRRMASHVFKPWMNAASRKRVSEVPSDLLYNSKFKVRRSCFFSDTDAKIDICQHVPGGLQFTFTTWHNLGSCSFPFDLKWERMVNPRNFRTLGQRESAFRDVERKWLQAMTKEKREREHKRTNLQHSELLVKRRLIEG
ncbi:hypothetical protein F4678DRAFT_74903 [Xylaria arbuscula]|nr:hypothetical protein F4678DRAFT_74903 [Xylaria arbuscula]